MTVKVLPYNPEWRVWYLSLKEKIWPMIFHNAIAIEHVGSTSVEGLAAKPCIDIDIVTVDRNQVGQCIPILESIGYEYRGDLGVRNREAFKCIDPIHPHNLYVCIDGSDALRNHLVFRDHLRTNSVDRKKYSCLKLELAQKYPNDIDSYIEGKTSFVISILSQYQFNRASITNIKSINKKRK